MQIDEVASVSAGRMFATGLSHLLIGLVWSIGPIVRFATDAGDAPVDARVVAVVVILWPLGIPILLRGLALLQQALGERGHFRVSAEGIELRLGAPSLYARLIGIIPQIRALPANPDTFAIRFPGAGGAGATWDASGYVYRFRWREIAAFEVSVFALVIELRSGARLMLRRFYFVEDPARIGRRLNEITQRLATNPLPHA
jgi:hypothetical protein